MTRCDELHIDVVKVSDTAVRYTAYCNLRSSPNDSRQTARADGNTLVEVIRNLQSNMPSMELPSDREV